MIPGKVHMVNSRKALAIFLGCALLASVATKASPSSVSIEIDLGLSGRKPPKALVESPAVQDSIATLLASLLGKEGVCPPDPVPFEYSGVLIRFDPVRPGLSRDWVVRQGSISHTGDAPRCLIDSGRMLERKALAWALPLQDASMAGPPVPMMEYACAIPDSLHPQFPCKPATIHWGATGKGRIGNRTWQNESIRLDGRRFREADVIKATLVPK